MVMPAYSKYPDSGLLMSSRWVDYSGGKPVYGNEGFIIGVGYRAHNIPITVLTEWGISSYPDGEYVDMFEGTKKKYKQDHHFILSVFSDYPSSRMFKEVSAGLLPRDIFCVGARFFTNLTHKAESYSGLEFVLRGRVPLMDRRSPFGIVVDFAMGKMFSGEDSASISIGIEGSLPVFAPIE